MQGAPRPVLPGIAAVVSPVMGLFYLVWFPMLARDLLRLGKRESA